MSIRLLINGETWQHIVNTYSTDLVDVCRENSGRIFSFVQSLPSSSDVLVLVTGLANRIEPIIRSIMTVSAALLSRGHSFISVSAYRPLPTTERVLDQVGQIIYKEYRDMALPIEHSSFVKKKNNPAHDSAITVSLDNKEGMNCADDKAGRLDASIVSEKLLKVGPIDTARLAHAKLHDSTCSRKYPVKAPVMINSTTLLTATNMERYSNRPFHSYKPETGNRENDANNGTHEYILIPNVVFYDVLGHANANIRLIQHTTGAEIDITTESQFFGQTVQVASIQGKVDQVKHAVNLLKQLIYHSRQL